MKRLDRNEEEAIIQTIMADLPADEPSIMRAARQAVVTFDLAVRTDRPEAALDAEHQYTACVYKLNNGTNFGCQGGPEAAGPRIARFAAADPGEVGMWMQKSEFLVEYNGMRAVLQSAGGPWLGYSRSWHAVDLDKPFISETGYLSALSLPTIWGATYAEAAAIWLKATAQHERKPRAIPDNAFIRTRPTEFPWVDAPAPAKPKTLTSSFEKGDLIELSF